MKIMIHRGTRNFSSHGECRESWCVRVVNLGTGISPWTWRGAEVCNVSVLSLGRLYRVDALVTRTKVVWNIQDEKMSSIN